MSRFREGDRIVISHEHQDSSFGSGGGRHFRIGDTGVVNSVFRIHGIQHYGIYLEVGYGRGSQWTCYEEELSLNDGKPFNPIERKIKQMWERQPFVKGRAA